MIQPPSDEVLQAAVGRNTRDARRVAPEMEAIGVFLGYLEALALDGHEVIIERLGGEVALSVNRELVGHNDEVRGTSLFDCVKKVTVGNE